MIENIVSLEPVLTVESLAALIHYHPESIRRAIRQGRIQAQRFGAGYRIQPTEARRIVSEGLPYSAKGN